MKADFLTRLTHALQTLANDHLAKVFTINLNESDIDNISVNNVDDVRMVLSSIFTSRQGANTIINFSYYLEGKLYCTIKWRNCRSR